MVGPLLDLKPEYRQAGEDRPLGAAVRGALVGISLALVGVFAVAAWLNPYDELGRPRRLETHRQLGLPACTFREVFGVPCPSCGGDMSFDDIPSRSLLFLEP